MEKYRYVHLFTIDSFIFNKAFQHLMYNRQDIEDHLFLYMHKKSFSAVEADNRSNCILEEGPFDVSTIRNALDKGQYLFIHNLGTFPGSEICKLTDEEANRIIWSIWGPDFFMFSVPKIQSKFYLLAQKIYRSLMYGYKECVRRTNEDIYFKKIKTINKISKFKAICAGFEGDIDKIHSLFPKVPCIQSIYSSDVYLEDIAEWQKKNPEDDSNNENIKILLGHAGDDFLQHEKWLDKLLPYKEKLEFYLPLSYGRQEYIQSLIIKAKELYGDRAHIFTDLMSTEEYFTKILSKVDFAIFDFPQQSAYGNALFLLLLGKKLFYPNNSTMYNTFTKNNVEVYKTEDLTIECLTELKKTPSSENNINFGKKRFDKKILAGLWNDVFKFLEEER